jgi:UDP-N-acetylmuramate--alanine ligase
METVKAYYLLGREDDRIVALAQVLSDLGNTIKVWDKPVHMIDKDEWLTSRSKEAFADEVEWIVLEEHDHLVQQTSVRVNHYYRFISRLLQQFTSIAVHGVQDKKTLAQWMCRVFSSFAPTSYLLDETWAKGTQEDNSYFIYEEDERIAARYSYQPDYAVITSMNDRLPHSFRNRQDLRQAFLTMASQVKKRVVACGDDLNTHVLLTMRPAFYYGFGVNNDLVAKNVKEVSDGLLFDVFLDKHFLERFKIYRRNHQFVQQALAIISVAILEGFELEKLRDAILESSRIY